MIGTFKLNQGILETMTDAKLDPKEFFSFMEKYDAFIKFGIVNKKALVIDSPEYNDATKGVALSAGTDCFKCFLEDFMVEYEQALLEVK